MEKVVKLWTEEEREVEVVLVVAEVVEGVEGSKSERFFEKSGI